MKLEQLPFLTGNPLIFTDRQHRTTTPVQFPTRPVGWTMADMPGWTTWRPAEQTLPTQGWKIHISATRATCQEVFRRVSTYCLLHQLAFKHVPTEEQLNSKNGKYTPRSGSGKFLTLYPLNDEDSVTHATALADLLSEFDGPYILTDLRWHDSIVYLRYGAYTMRTRPNPDTGEDEYCIEHPDGSLVPDDRSPVFTVPEWVTPPPAIQEVIDARAGTDDWMPFTITDALHFSNGGGVYKGELHGRSVVVKEARSLTGLSHDGHDAQTRLRRESAALLELGDIPGVPRHYGFFRVWEHEFLCMEEAPGLPFIRYMSQNCPLYHTSSQQERDEYTRTTQQFLLQLETVLREVHARDYVYGDVSPNNVMVDTKTGTLTLIDWEATQRSGSFTRGLATPGYMPPKELEPPQQDLFGLVRLALNAFCGLSSLCEISPHISKAHRRYIASFFGADALTFLDDLTDRCFPQGFPDPPTELDAGQVPTVTTLAQGVQRLWTTYGTTVPPLSIEEFDPVTRDLVWTGSAGLAMALRHTGHGIEELDRIVAERMSESPSSSLGFFKGLGGQAVFLAQSTQPQVDRFAGRLAVMAHKAAESSHSQPVDLSKGTGGTLLAAIMVERRAPYLGVEPHIRPLAERLAADIPTGAPPRQLPAGLESGWSGAAIALIAAADHLGDDTFLSHARRALDHDLARCAHEPRTGTMQFDEGQRMLPYVGTGSLGVALAVQEYLHRRNEADLHEPLTAIARNLECATCVFSGLMGGRAGLLLAAKTLDERFLPAPREEIVTCLEEGLSYHTFHDDLGVYVTGDQNSRLSSDYSYGSAGVMVALNAQQNERFSWLPCAF